MGRGDNQISLHCPCRFDDGVERDASVDDNFFEEVLWDSCLGDCVQPLFRHAVLLCLVQSQIGEFPQVSGRAHHVQERDPGVKLLCNGNGVFERLEREIRKIYRHENVLENPWSFIPLHNGCRRAKQFSFSSARPEFKSGVFHGYGFCVSTYRIGRLELHSPCEDLTVDCFRCYWITWGPPPKFEASGHYYLFSGNALVLWTAKVG